MRLQIPITFLAMVGIALGAGYVNDTNRVASYNKGVEVVQLGWGATGYVQAVSDYTTDYVQGHVDRVVLRLTHATTNAANYVVTISDQNGLDVLAGLGAALATNTTHNLAPGLMRQSATINTPSNMAPWSVNEKLLVTVTNCGSNATGLIYLYLSQP